MALGISTLTAILSTLATGATGILVYLSPIGGLLIFLWGIREIWFVQNYELKEEIFYTLVFLVPFIGLFLYLTLADRWEAVKKIGDFRG
jgi:hypothetical protein